MHAREGGRDECEDGKGGPHCTIYGGLYVQRGTEVRWDRRGASISLNKLANGSINCPGECLAVVERRFGLQGGEDGRWTNEWQADRSLIRPGNFI